MKRRTLGLGIVLGMTALAAGLTTGCSSGGAGGQEDAGKIALSLSTQGPSGTEYRLREAIFEIRNDEYDYYGAGGDSGTSGEIITVSSEDDPNASSISVSVERGYHRVRLLPGWHLEKIEGGSPTVVEATLLSSETQWIYVQPRASTWVAFQFGLGDRKIWFNGDLNIDIQVFEDPSDLYGGGGGQGPTPDNEAGAGGL
jgi:hypothetical protein